MNTEDRPYENNRYMWQSNIFEVLIDIFPEIASP